jgi:outer membrane protein
MKKLFLALIVFAGLGSTAIAQGKIGHVRMEVLWDTIPSTQIAADKFTKYEQMLVTELQEMQMTIQKAYKDYETMMSAAEKPSDMRRQIAEQEIQKKEAALQERQRTMQLERQARQQELEGPIQDRILKAIKIVAEREKLSYVLDEGSTYFHAGGYDITNTVVVELMKLEKEAAASAATVPAPTGGQ